MKRLTAMGLCLLSGVLPAAADQVVPLGYENTPGTAGFLGPLASSARSYQMLIHADELTGLVGMNLTGIAFRSLASATTAWPASAATYANYDVYLGQSVDPANRSTTLALNEVGAQTQVRSGPLMIMANAYPFGGSPNEFGPTIEFTQPYLYTGGNLLVTIRHEGNDISSSRSVDALSTSTTGYGTSFGASWGSGYASTGGSQGNFAIVKFSSEPGTGGCYANCDGSTGAPALNVADFGCFLSKFAAGDPYANCDGSTGAPQLNVADFGCFLTKFAAGCP